MLAIINAELVMRDHLIPEAVLFVENGKIIGFGELRSTPIPEDCEILDAKGLYVGPGLVDIHTHTGGENIAGMYMEGPYINPKYGSNRAVGLTDRGEIAVGKRADLVITDHKMNISTVILNGTVR